jgi:hypothetical protein
MTDKSRERNYVNLLSDYGLDERQKSEQNKLGLKVFRGIRIATAALYCLWVIFLCLNNLSILSAWVAFSFDLVIEGFYCYYGVKASNLGIINGITSFSLKSKSNLMVVVFLMVFMVFAITKGLLGKFTVFLIATSVVGITSQLILYFCAKRNDKVLDEQAVESEEDQDE